MEIIYETFLHEYAGKTSEIGNTFSISKKTHCLLITWQYALAFINCWFSEGVGLMFVGSNLLLQLMLVYHYDDVMVSAMPSQITTLTIVHSTVYPGADQRKHPRCSAPMAFLPGIHRWPMISTHKGPVPRKMFPCDDVIMSHKWPDNHTSMRRFGDMMLIEDMKVSSRIWKVSFIFQAANFPDEN